jgi:hypothetical protein
MFPQLQQQGQSRQGKRRTLNKAGRIQDLPWVSLSREHVPTFGLNTQVGILQCLARGKATRPPPPPPPFNNSTLFVNFPSEQSPHDAHLPNNDNLVVRWGNDGKISTSFANWIPPNNICPPPAAAHPTKISKGMQHAKEILGKSFYTFEFNNMMKTTNNDMPFDHKLTTNDISTTKSHGSGNSDSNQSPHPSGSSSPQPRGIHHPRWSKSPHPSGSWSPQPWGSHQP